MDDRLLRQLDLLVGNRLQRRREHKIQPRLHAMIHVAPELPRIRQALRLRDPRLHRNGLRLQRPLEHFVRKQRELQQRRQENGRATYARPR